MASTRPFLPSATSLTYSGTDDAMPEPQLLEVGCQAVEGAGLHGGAHSEPPIESSRPRLAAAAASMSPAASPNHRLPAMASA